jgi:acetyl esterase
VALAQLNLPDLSTVEPALAREFSNTRAKALPPGPEALVTSLAIPAPGGDIPVRIYRPLGSEQRALPAVVYFHGGGFVVGSLAQSDADCRRMATAVPCVVVNVDYPLAPEYKFPEPPEACFAALSYIAEQAVALSIDRTRIAVGGDSAGGNLATVVALMARDRGGPAITHQILMYPVADLTTFDTASYLANATGYYLTRTAMQWFAGHYLRSPGDARDPLASPLHAELAGLPPALVITAEFDPLRDEGEAYARRLQAAGVATRLSRYDGMIHGFYTMSAYLDGGKRAGSEVISALQAAFRAR